MFNQNYQTNKNSIKQLKGNGVWLLQSTTELLDGKLRTL